MNAPKKYWWLILVAVPIAVVTIPALPSLFKKESAKPSVSQNGNSPIVQEAHSAQKLSIAGNSSGTFAVNQQSGGISTAVLTNQQVVNVSGGSVTFNNNNGPDTATKLAIDALNTVVMSATTKVELTREEVRLLAKALKDLDERTAALTKLPDGRSQFGSIVAGAPTRVMEAMTNTLAHVAAKGGRFAEVDWPTVFRLASNGIALHEGSEIKPFGAYVSVRPEALGSFYETAALASHICRYTNFTLSWIEKAFSSNPTLETGVLRTWFLSLYGNPDDARTSLRALKEKHGDNPVEAVRKQLGIDPGQFN